MGKSLYAWLGSLFNEGQAMPSKNGLCPLGPAQLGLLLSECHDLTRQGNRGVGVRAGPKDPPPLSHCAGRCTRDENDLIE